MNTIIEKIRAEVRNRIQQIKDAIEEEFGTETGTYLSGKKIALEEFDFFLAYFKKECEKPTPAEGLELKKEIDMYFKDWDTNSNGAFFNEDGYKIDTIALKNIARHFAQWQKEQMMKDGLDAVKSGQFNKIEKTIAGVFVKYGMDRQRETMLKEAVDVDTSMAEYNDADFKSYLWNILMMKGAINGQKVKLIIVKED